VRVQSSHSFRGAATAQGFSPTEADEVGFSDGFANGEDFGGANRIRNCNRFFSDGGVGTQASGDRRFRASIADEGFEAARGFNDASGRFESDPRENPGSATANGFDVAGGSSSSTADCCPLNQTNSSHVCSIFAYMETNQ
jgi:hypothetical protein